MAKRWTDGKMVGRWQSGGLFFSCKESIAQVSKKEKKRVCTKAFGDNFVDNVDNVDRENRFYKYRKNGGRVFWVKCLQNADFEKNHLLM